MIRAVNTGVINVRSSLLTLLQRSDIAFQLSLAVQESAEKLSREERVKRAKKNIPVVDNNNAVSNGTIIEENSKINH